MSLSIADISDNIWRNALNQSSLTSIPEIAYWVRSQGIGQLNSIIFASFTIDSSTLEIEQEFTNDELAILTQIYLIKFYQLQATNFLGAVGVSDITELSEKGHTIRRLNRTEQSKVFLTLKKDCEEQLSQLTGQYKINRATPRDIGGIDQHAITYPATFNRSIIE